MAKLLVSLPDCDYAEFKKKATSLGLTTSAYIRTVIKDAEHRDKEHKEVLRAIMALVPTIAEAFGRTHEKDAKQTEGLAQRLMDCYVMERSDKHK